MDGGGGADHLRVIADRFGTGADADLATDKVSYSPEDGDPHLLEVPRFENLTMFGFFPLVMRGDEGANVLTARNCTHPQTIEGRGGDDRLVLANSTFNITGCYEADEPDSPGDLHGGAGDDELVGDFGDDTLDGGEGYDTADGSAGSDLCGAEVVANCEGQPSGKVSTTS